LFETHDTIAFVSHLKWRSNLAIALDARTGGCLKHVETRVVAWKLMSALRYLHEYGVLHRDLKAANVLCSVDDATDVCLADFGLSRFVRPSETVSGDIGTLAYQSPELLQRNAYGVELDVWALGVLVYQCVGGQFPFGDAAVTAAAMRSEIVAGFLRFHPYAVWHAAPRACRDLVEGRLGV
jgi:serine/threonine protein kinase